MPSERSSIVSDTIAVVLLGLHLLSWIFPSALTVTLSLIPEYTLVTRFYLWNVLSCALFEPFPPFVALTSLAFVVIGRRVEARLGHWSLFRYLLMTHVCSATAAFFAAYIRYVAFGIETALLHFYTGSPGLLVALLVAAKQSFPDEAIDYGSARLSVTYLPLGVTVAIIAAEHMGLRSPTPLPTAASSTVVICVSFVCGWLWLRFLQPRSELAEDILQGDTSESFAIHQFFPTFMHMVLRPVAAVIYGCLLKLGCCGNWHNQYTARLREQAIIEEEMQYCSPRGCLETADRRRYVEELEKRLERTLRGSNDEEAFDLL